MAANDNDFDVSQGVEDVDSLRAEIDRLKTMLAQAHRRGDRFKELLHVWKNESFQFEGEAKTAQKRVAELEEQVEQLRDEDEG